MTDNRILSIVYTFFLGLLLALFVGAGINTFYPGPKAPEFPIEMNTYGKELTTEQAVKQREFDQKNQDYNKAMKPYNRNVSIITTVAAVLLLAASILTEKRVRILADGVMLGGLLTLLYGLGRGFASEDSKYVFGVITVALIAVMYLGYHRFVVEHTVVATKSRKKL